MPRRTVLAAGATAATTAAAAATLMPATAALAGQPEPGAAGDDLRELVQGELKRAIGAGYPGMVIGALAGRLSYVGGAGRRAEAGSPPPDADTLFQLASITKTFTATGLALAAELGKVELTGAANRYLPPDLAIPAHRNIPVTLTHLSNHTSGLPELPPNLPSDPDFRPADPYAVFTRDKLVAGLRRTKLVTKPGAKYTYSNYGAGMLGHALETIYRRPYDALLRPITHTLGLRDITTTLTGERRRRKASGHTETGQSTVDWRFATLAGCGALYGTANDLMRYVRAQLAAAGSAGFGPAPAGPLGRAIATTHRRTHQYQARQWVGLGWHETVGKYSLIWHNGSTYGYRSFAGFVPSAGVGVVILTNTAKEADSIGVRVISELVKLSGG